MTEPTRFEPASSPAGEPFWAATRDRRLVLPWCDRCGRPHWYPREACPHCSGSSFEWREASGLGTVHAVSIQYRAGFPGLGDRVPYPVVLVDLDEGVRMMSGVASIPAEEVAVGLAVRAGWEPLSDGRNLVVFEPVG